MRTEVGYALATDGVTVIPVLLNGTPLPRAAELPGELRELTKRQAVPYRSKFATQDTAYLAACLSEFPEIGGVPPRPGPADRPPRRARLFDLRPFADLLSAGRWEEADRESARMLWTAAGGDPGTLRRHLIRTEQIDEIAAEDLDAIDRLWRRHSGDRFGFAPQLDALRRAKGDPRAFAEDIGWFTDRWIFYHEARFTLSAPPGHLPILGPVGGIRPPWKYRLFRHGYVGTSVRLPVELTRYLSDRETVRRVHGRAVDESFGWPEYMQMRAHAGFELVADAFKARARPLRRLLKEAPARRVYFPYAETLSVIWAITRVRLLERLE